jgi:hypothetical protein
MLQEKAKDSSKNRMAAEGSSQRSQQQMTNQNPWAVIVTGAIKLLGIMLLLCVVAAWWLTPIGGRALRRFTVAGRVPVARLLRLVAGWPPEEAINTPPTATVLALILWSVLGTLTSGVLVLLGAPLLCLLIGFLAGLVTGALCSLMKEPQPQRPQRQRLEDVFPPGWDL